jgi:hypothetical protein
MVNHMFYRGATLIRSSRTLAALALAVVITATACGGELSASDPAFEGYHEAEVNDQLNANREGSDEDRKELVVSILAFRTDCRAIYELIRDAGGLSQPKALDAVAAYKPIEPAWNEIFDVIGPSLDAGDTAAVAEVLENNCKGTPADPARAGDPTAPTLDAVPG